MEDFNYEILSISDEGTVTSTYVPDDNTLETRTISVHSPNAFLADIDSTDIRNLVAANAPQAQWTFEKSYDQTPVASQQHEGLIGDEADILPSVPAVASTTDLDTYIQVWQRIYTDSTALNAPAMEDGVLKVEETGNTTDLVQLWRSLETDLCYLRRRVAGVFQPWREILMRREGYNIVEQNFTAGKPKFGSEPEWVTLSNGLCAFEFKLGNTMCNTLAIPADYLYGTPVDLGVFFHLKSAPANGDIVTWRASFVSGRCDMGDDMLAAPIVVDVTYTCDGTETVGELLCDSTGEIVYLAPPGAILVYNIELLAKTTPGLVVVAHTTKITYKTNQAFSTDFPM
jgi:hypothetical protein